MLSGGIKAERGVLIECRQLAGHLKKSVSAALSGNAWQLRLNRKGAVELVAVLQRKPVFGNGTLAKEFVINAVRDLKLWLEPMQSLCERGANIKVSEIMCAPDDFEYPHEEDSVGKGLHEYVMGMQQPLIVKNGDTVTGFLDFLTDLCVRWPVISNKPFEFYLQRFFNFFPCSSSTLNSSTI